MQSTDESYLENQKRPYSNIENPNPALLILPVTRRCNLKQRRQGSVADNASTAGLLTYSFILRHLPNLTRWVIQHLHTLLNQWYLSQKTLAGGNHSSEHCLGFKDTPRHRLTTTHYGHLSTEFPLTPPIMAKTVLKTKVVILRKDTMVWRENST